MLHTMLLMFMWHYTCRDNEPVKTMVLLSFLVIVITCSIFARSKPFMYNYYSYTHLFKMDDCYKRNKTKQKSETGSFKIELVCFKWIKNQVSSCLHVRLNNKSQKI
jgi:hypothetical protein